jgi:hypothetical protein
MSKKSRRRNKKILAMLALAGGAAMAGRRKRNAAIDTGIASAEADKGSAMLADSAPVVKTDTADIAPVVKKPIVPAGTDMKGFGHPIIQGNINRKKAFLAKANIPGQGTAVAPPGILNPYRAPRARGHPLMQGRITNYKKGGSVKKAKVTGIAKRGFGRALMKGKK